MADDPNGQVATTYHEPAMAAANRTRQTARTEPANGRVNKAPTGPRFTLPNDARVQEQPMQTRAQTQAQTQSTGTIQPIDEEVEMQDAEGEGTRRRVAARSRELVPVKPPKNNPPIRAVDGGTRFTIDEALNQVVILPLKQLLNISQAARKQMAFALQSLAPQYKRKKVPKATQPAVGTVEQARMTRSHLPQPPAVGTKAHKNNNLASLFFVTA